MQQHLPGPQPNLNRQEDTYWKVIIDSIRTEKCILFIGPEIFAPSPREKLSDKLLQYLDNEIQIQSDPDIRHYDHDDLFYFRKRKKKWDTCFNVKQFYKQSFEDTGKLLTKISQIPFHCVISINPDNKLKEVFEESDFIFKFDSRAAYR